MKEICECGSSTISTKPVKYSPNDRFSHYRRKSKLDEYAKRGLL